MKSIAVALLAISLYILSGSDRHEPSSISNEGARRLRIREERIKWKAARQVELTKKFALLQALRTDLASPWTSLVVAQHYVCSCTGKRPGGFEITRHQGTITLAPWGDLLWYKSHVQSRTLSEEQLETILSVLPAHFHTAMLVDDPYEAAGPRFAGENEDPGWRARLIRAGGYPYEPGDRFGIEIRVETAGGLKTYVDYVEPHYPFEFDMWMYRMHEPKNGE